MKAKVVFVFIQALKISFRQYTDRTGQRMVQMNINNEKEIVKNGKRWDIIDRSQYVNFDGDLPPCAEVEGHIEVEWSSIYLAGRTRQTRQGDVDKGHITTLSGQIKNTGLNRLPTVEWDAMQNKFVPLGGHHRLFAMKKLGWDRFPVLVVDFGKNPEEKFDWLLGDNKHDAVKNHSKLDAIAAVNRAYTEFGRFKGHEEDEDGEKKMKEEVYAFLKEHFSQFHGRSKESIWKEAFGGKVFNRKKRFTKSEFDDEVKKFYGRDVKAGQISGDWGLVRSEATAAIKSMQQTKLKRAEQLDCGNATNTLDLDVMTFFPERDIESARKNFLGQMRLENKYLSPPHPDLGDKPLSVVRKVVFLPQILEPAETKETVWVKYEWDPAKEDFFQPAQVQ